MKPPGQPGVFFPSKKKKCPVLDTNNVRLFLKKITILIVIFSNNIVYTILIIIHFQIKSKNYLGPKLLSEGLKPIRFQVRVTVALIGQQIILYIPYKRHCTETDSFIDQEI